MHEAEAALCSSWYLPAAQWEQEVFALINSVPAEQNLHAAKGWSDSFWYLPDAHGVHGVLAEPNS